MRALVSKDNAEFLLSPIREIGRQNDSRADIDRGSDAGAGTETVALRGFGTGKLGDGFGHEPEPERRRKAEEQTNEQGCEDAEIEKPAESYKTDRGGALFCRGCAR